MLNNKAKSLIGAARKIVNEFGGNVPQTLEELITVPGAARKTSNVVLGVAFGIAAICAILQSVATSGDLDVGHHIYLLVALIALILGVLIAVQTERVRMATK